MSEEATDYYHPGMRCPIRECIGNIRSKERCFYCTECGFSFKDIEFKKKEEETRNGES